MTYHLARAAGWLQRGTVEGTGQVVRGTGLRGRLVECRLVDRVTRRMRDAGRVVTRDQLMREVWDTTWWSSTKTLDMHISWLRKKLGDDAANPKPGELRAIASDPSPTANPIGQSASQTARLRPPAGFMRASSQAPRASSIGDGELASSQHPERVSPKLRM